MIILILIILLIAFLIITYAVSILKKLTINDEARKEAPGKFI